MTQTVCLKLFKYLGVLVFIFFPLSHFGQTTPFTGPIFHANGIFASSGDPSTPFYHENSQLAYSGIGQSDQKIYYKNGTIAWKGALYEDSFFDRRNSYAYHANGNAAWKGQSCSRSYFLTDTYIFHNDGSIAWKGRLYKDCFWGTTDCCVKFKNGVTAWEGSFDKSSGFFNDRKIIYHSNGMVAWRGEFAQSGSARHYSAIFYENGAMAWTGMKGDPIYDKDGYILTPGAEAINLAIGEGSWLYISHSGHMNLHLNLGEDSFLSFSNKDEEPRLLIHLGPGMNLYMYPYSGAIPELVVHGVKFPLRSKK
jgi:hypothetical protein